MQDFFVNKRAILWSIVFIYVLTTKELLVEYIAQRYLQRKIVYKQIFTCYYQK